MRDYGKIFTSFWTEFQGVSDQGRILGAYLLSGPHTNMLGCFRLPFGYVQEDLQWNKETVSEAFEELFRNGFATHEKASETVFIHKFLKWNEIENPNQGKAAVKTFDQLPEKCGLKVELAKAMLEFCPFLPDAFRNRFETLQEPFRNQEPEPEPEPEEKNPTPPPSAPVVDAPPPRKRSPRSSKPVDYGGYPPEVVQAMADWRELGRYLRSPEILERFPEGAKFVAQVGTREEVWRAWQERRKAHVNGLEVTHQDILTAVRLWAKERRRDADEGSSLRAKSLPALINWPGFVDALVEAVKSRTEVVDVAS